MATTAHKIDYKPPSGMDNFWGIVGSAMIFLWLSAVAVYAILPFMWIFSPSLRTPDTSFNLPPSFIPQTWEWENWYQVIVSPRINFPLFFVNSLKIATSVAVPPDWGERARWRYVCIALISAAVPSSLITCPNQDSI